jgi:dephospho-CoA kinase
MKRVVSVVGMSGTGKSEVAEVFEAGGYYRIRFGDITDEGITRRNLKPGEASERRVREMLREEHGMAAYALLNLPKIEAALQRSDVVIDGLYSWEEYLVLKERYGDNLILVAVWSSPRTRYSRLAARPVRPLTREQAESRDRAEVENSHKGGPIAVADFTIINESSMAELKQQTREVMSSLW